MTHSSFTWRWLAWPLHLALLAGAASAHDEAQDHERARTALQAGEALPLKEILERVQKAYPGQVLDVELERGHRAQNAPWIYKLKVLRENGMLIRLKVNARDGKVLSTRPRGLEPVEGR